MAKEIRKRKKRKKVELFVPETKGDAVNYLLIGWKYFLMRSRVSAIVTLFATGYALFGPVLIGTLYYLSDKVTIQKAVPAIPATPTFDGVIKSQSPFMLVQNAARPRGLHEIWLPNRETGKLEYYGINNIRYSSFVVEGGKYDGWILVWDIKDREGVWMESDFKEHIKEEVQKSLKKGY